MRRKRKRKRRRRGRLSPMYYSRVEKSDMRHVATTAARKKCNLSLRGGNTPSTARQG